MAAPTIGPLVDSPPPPPPPENKPGKGKWRPTKLTTAVFIVFVAGILLLTYPTAASWLSQYNQSKLIKSAMGQPDDAAERLALLEEAHAYNDALEFGVLVAANANVAESSGTQADESLNYWDMLRIPGSEVMSRVQIPKIDVDIPVYHGTSEATLLKGAGHLEGSHLPVGGIGTRTVITAHRGLASARMFTDLNKIEEGDTFRIITLGEIMAYEVTDVTVVKPEESDILFPDEDKDQATLITCTPLGINSHRILVTGDRILPLPAEDAAAGSGAPLVPRFPWWLLFLVGGLGGSMAFYYRAGYKDYEQRQARDAKKQLAGDTNPTEQTDR